MKRLAFTILGTLALTACSSEPAEEAATDETAAAPVVEETVAADTTSNAAPGTYEVTMADGMIMTSVLNEDGTYTDSVDGEVTESGTWAVTDGKTCFTPAADSEGSPMCYADSEIGADGTFTATPDEGDPITVKKVS